MATGEQWMLRRGADEVIVVAFGGGLRSWTRAGVPVLAGYAADEPCRSSRGQVLFPWPNRLRDGRWQCDDVEQQLPLTEPDKHNAIHGLVRFIDWQLIEQSSESVTIGCDLRAQPGWPWPFAVELSYALDEQGLSVCARVTNSGTSPARFGLGFHPYIAFTGAVADVELQVPFEERLVADERLLPIGRERVAGTTFDFVAERKIGESNLDTAYAGPIREEDGRWRVRVAGATVWAGEGFDALQMFTGRAGPDQPVPGIAVEPMTCPPDALNSGEGLIELGPGQAWRGAWGIDLPAPSTD